MTTFYSPGVTGFFDTSIHSGEQIPADAIKVSQARRGELLRGLSLGQVIRVSSGGDLELADRPVDPDCTIMYERAWRDVAISQVSWLRDRHRDQLDIGVEATLKPEQFSELLVYMQALRDWPQSEAFPDSSARPAPPTFLEPMRIGQ